MLFASCGASDKQTTQDGFSQEVLESSAQGLSSDWYYAGSNSTHHVFSRKQNNAGLREVLQRELQIFDPMPVTTDQSRWRQVRTFLDPETGRFRITVGR